MKSLLIRPYAKYLAHQCELIRKNALKDQEQIFKMLLSKGGNTLYGREHGLEEIKDYRQFTEHVPLADYEGGRKYFDQIKEGKKDITWPGLPKYLAKTSGTTSGTKYIPITSDSMTNHIGSARLALMNYASKGTNSRIFDGKVMFLSGSPVLSDTHGIATGRLSGIVNHEIPTWLKGNQLPSYKTNCVEEWEDKVDRIVEETKNQDLRLISGIPPWVQMYFERLLSASGKSTVKEIFPNLQLFVYGGVNYEPYRVALENLIGTRIDSLETFPASEGFLAFQDQMDDRGLLLNTNSGIFFEFVPLQNIFDANPSRLRLHDVELGKDYAVIINNNAGLWGYNIGDTVQFVQKDPYRIVVSGRVKHFISAFGEHVIAKEIEESLLIAAGEMSIAIKEFTVAPQVNPIEGGQPYHEWFIEFDQEVHTLSTLAAKIDSQLRLQNIYYNDLIKGNILKPLVIRMLKKDAFRIMMKNRGKLGGQNKVPRLSNDRSIAEELFSQNLIIPNES